MGVVQMNDNSDPEEGPSAWERRINSGREIKKKIDAAQTPTYIYANTHPHNILNTNGGEAENKGAVTTQLFVMLI